MYSRPSAIKIDRNLDRDRELRMDCLSQKGWQRVKRTRRRRIARWIAGTVLVLVVLIMGFGLMSATTGNHTMRSVTYAQAPPHSGDHSPVWQRCGFYSKPVRDEHVVHSLEHGVVWIAFRPDMAANQIQLLREFEGGAEHLIVSPYPGLQPLVVVSAWGHQQSFDSLDMAALTRVVQDLRNGDDAPEAGGSCEGPNLFFSGATGSPED